MSPEALELIEEIESERTRTRELLDDVEAQVEASDVRAKALLEALRLSNIETKEALKILRRAGLLPD